MSFGLVMVESWVIVGRIIGLGEGCVVLCSVERVAEGMMESFCVPSCGCLIVGSRVILRRVV